LAVVASGAIRQALAAKPFQTITDGAEMNEARKMLRVAYDAVIEQINSSRGSQQLTNAFYSKIGDAVFEACYSALENSEAAKAGVKVAKALQVVSAPMGAGKTTFTLAFITALVRLRENRPDMPYGCVFLVEQMTKADEMYRELSALLPGKVAVWTTDHDVQCKSPTKVLKPAARFHVDDLENHEVAIVTHAFYKGKRGLKARDVIHGNHIVPRALTVIDEQTDDVAVFDVTLFGVAAVLEAVQRDERTGDIALPYVRSLLKFMATKLSGGSLEKPSDDPSTWDRVASELAWFATTTARDYERDHKGSIGGLDGVFSFARALTTTQAFVAATVPIRPITWATTCASNFAPAWYCWTQQRTLTASRHSVSGARMSRCRRPAMLT
jgi:hypothetical protein